MSGENWYLGYTYRAERRIAQSQGNRILVGHMRHNLSHPALTVDQREVTLEFQEAGDIAEIVPRCRKVTSEILSAAGVTVEGPIMVQAALLGAEPKWQDVSHLLDSPETPAP